MSDANRAAVEWLDRWATWPVPVALLIGPAGSGKSHLTRIFARRTGAVAIDDAEGRDQEALFHAWNAASRAQPLLLVARALPAVWVQLPDLASRLAATPTAAIMGPDDTLLAAVLAKRFADRGLRVSPEVASYVLARIERSFVAVGAIVEALDAASLAQGRALSVPLARAVLEAQGELPLKA